MIKSFKIPEIFTIKSGDYHAIKELDSGDIPLISCGELDNGFIGNFDIPENKRYSNTITVAYNGQPLTAKYHPYQFGAKDDVAVLLPHSEMREKTLVYIASLLNQQTWKYSYGRKCFKGKLTELTINLPVVDPDGALDEDYISRILDHNIEDLLPVRNENIDITEHGEIIWKSFPITNLFTLQKGDFHKIADLDPGTVNTVSRVATDNGVVGKYTIPEGAHLYNPPVITVSTLNGDAFVQLDPFIATDNVIMLLPREELKPTTLFFVEFMLNHIKWRYSYGRQCYKTKFAQTKIHIPVNRRGNLNESLMERIVKNTSYWCTIEGHLN